MQAKTTTGKKQRFVLLMGVCVWGGGMFVLFNFSFIRDIHDYRTPYIVFRLVLSAILFGVGGFMGGSLLARRFGLK